MFNLFTSELSFLLTMASFMIILLGKIDVPKMKQGKNIYESAKPKKTIKRDLTPGERTKIEGAIKRLKERGELPQNVNTWKDVKNTPGETKVRIEAGFIKTSSKIEETNRRTEGKDTIYYISVEKTEVNEEGEGGGDILEARMHFKKKYPAKYNHAIKYIMDTKKMNKAEAEIYFWELATGTSYDASKESNNQNYYKDNFNIKGKELKGTPYKNKTAHDKTIKVKNKFLIRIKNGMPDIEEMEKTKGVPEPRGDNPPEVRGTVLPSYVHDGTGVKSNSIDTTIKFIDPTSKPRYDYKGDFLKDPEGGEKFDKMKVTWKPDPKAGGKMKISEIILYRSDGSKLIVPPVHHDDFIWANNLAPALHATTYGAVMKLPKNNYSYKQQQQIQEDLVRIDPKYDKPGKKPGEKAWPLYLGLGIPGSSLSEFGPAPSAEYPKGAVRNGKQWVYTENGRRDWIAYVEDKNYESKEAFTGKIKVKRQTY